MSESRVQEAVINKPWSDFNRAVGIALELGKVRISLLASLSATLGFVLARGGFSLDAILPTVGMLCLASGSAALNQIQDCQLDARMKRTAKRPLPSGRVNMMEAWFTVAVFVAAGCLILGFGTNGPCLALGLFAMFWYNVVYTYLKRVSAFAVIPGSLIGAIPPLAGWVAAGGSLSDPAIITLGFFFFIWQIPHFWLLIMLFGPEYEKAGVPTLLRVFTMKRLARLIFIWVLCTTVTAVALPLFFGMPGESMGLAITLLSAWMAASASVLIRFQPEPGRALKVFRDINIYALGVILILSIGTFI